MRKVRFSSRFRHESLYAYENVLDFIITFSGGNMVLANQPPKIMTVLSASLINAYSIENT
jgi:hypothetical protein